MCRLYSCTFKGLPQNCTFLSSLLLWTIVQTKIAIYISWLCSRASLWRRMTLNLTPNLPGCSSSFNTMAWHCIALSTKLHFRAPEFYITGPPSRIKSGTAVAICFHAQTNAMQLIWDLLSLLSIMPVLFLHLVCDCRLAAGRCEFCRFWHLCDHLIDYASHRVTCRMWQCMWRD